VYGGVKIDYSGKNVQPSTFLNVLMGNHSAVAGKGTGRVLESTSSDNVFIYFADHGAPGIIAFPSSQLHANDLMTALAHMTSANMYSKLVFYLEVIHDLFRHVNQDQCSPISPPTPKSMQCLQQTQVNPHGVPTALLMMWWVARTLAHAWEICSVSSGWKILRPINLQPKPCSNSSKL
jgi:hypothetical protein